MRFHTRTLSSHHRARFQIAKGWWNELVKQGAIFQTTRVMRLVDGVRIVRPQQWILVTDRRHFAISNLGHGWFETTISRDPDPLVDRGLLAQLKGCRAHIVPDEQPKDRTVRSIADYLDARAVRDQRMIKQGLNPHPRTVDYISLLTPDHIPPLNPEQVAKMREVVSKHRPWLVDVTHTLRQLDEPPLYHEKVKGPTVTSDRIHPQSIPKHKAPTEERLTHLMTRFNRK